MVFVHIICPTNFDAEVGLLLRHFDFDFDLSK